MQGQGTTEAKAETTKQVTQEEQEEIKRCCSNMEDIPEETTRWYVRNALRTESIDMKKIIGRFLGVVDEAHLDTVVDALEGIDFNPTTIRLLHAAMGMETEVGEFMDPLKKFLFYGKPIDKTNLAEETGDLLWYCAVASDALGISLHDIMETNIAKLRNRFPEKFTEDYAINRDLDTERNTLERGLT